jgi:drug/metabolite transporter (DMT)-like permease|nr:MAG: permease [Vulcanisaeta sp. AZ3]
MVGVLVAWGSSYSLTKLALNYMSPFVLAMFRFLLGGFVLAVVGGGVVFSRKSFINALLNSALFVAFLNLAVEYSVNPALASVLIYTQPLFVVLLALLFYRERLTVFQMIGVVVAFVGLLLTVGITGFDLGDVLSIVGGFVWALGTHYYRRNLANEDLIRLNAALGLYSAIIDSPLLALNPGIDLTFNAFLWGVVTALVAQVMGFILWFLAVKDLGPVTASSVSILVPVSAFVFAYLLLDRVPTVMEAVGSAVTLIGVMLTQLRRNPQT